MRREARGTTNKRRVDETAPLVEHYGESPERGADEEEVPVGVLLGQRVTQLRQQQRLSQRGLDRLAGFGHGWVSALESGQLENPGLDSAYRLAKALRVPLSALLGFGVREGELGPGEVRVTKEASEDVDLVLQELYSSLHAIALRDPQRIAAIRVLVRDMEEQTLRENP